MLALARVMLEAEQWHDLYGVAKALVRAAVRDTPGADLTSEERRLLTEATKQVLCAIRAAWRHCRLDASKPDGLTDSYRQHLEHELFVVATETAQLLETTLLATVKSPEPQIHYRTLVGDCYRYLAEIGAVPVALSSYDSLTYPPVLHQRRMQHTAWRFTWPRSISPHPLYSPRPVPKLQHAAVRGASGQTAGGEVGHGGLRRRHPANGRGRRGQVHQDHPSDAAPTRQPPPVGKMRQCRASAFTKCEIGPDSKMRISLVNVSSAAKH